MLVRHSVVYLVARGIPGAINFLALAVFTRLLTPDTYGVYALVIAGVGLVDAVLFQWLRLGLLRFLPDCSRHREQLLATLVAAFLVLILLTLAAAVLLWLIQPPGPLRTFLLLGAVLLWVSAWFELNLELVRAQLTPLRYGAYAVMRSSLALVFGFVFIKLGWGAGGLLLGLIGAMILPLLLLNSLREWQNLRITDKNPALLRQLLAYGLPLTATFALGFVVSSSDRFLLGWLRGSQEAGLYAVGYDLAQFTIGMLMMIVNLAAYPLAVRAMEQSGIAAAQEQLKQNALLLLAVALPASAGLAVLASNVSLVILGESYRAAATMIIPWIAFSALLGGVKAFYIDVGFQLGRNTVQQIWVMAVAAGVNVLLNLWWIPQWGIMGAVYATAVAYLVAIVLSWVLVRRVFPLPPPPTESLKLVLASLVMVGVVWLLRTWQGAPALALQVVIGGIVYSAIIILLNTAGIRQRLRHRFTRVVP